MFSWLAANAATIIISAILAVIVFFLVRAVVTNRVSCGGNCANCGHHPQPAAGGAEGGHEPGPMCGACSSNGACQAQRGEDKAQR